MGGDKLNERRKTSKVVISVLIFSIMLFAVVMTNKTTVSAKEDKNPYYIKINKEMNTITVYGKDSKGNYTVPVKAMICSTGEATPIGTFKTQAKYRWKILSGNVWGQYSTRITGSYLFHSVYYYEKDPSTLSVKQYNRLGTTASKGCVRITVIDAKWLYENCPVGTTVEIYKSKDPGPLGKPTAMKLSYKYKWDPTDTTNPKNPYNKKSPKITGAKNVTITVGTKVDVKKGIKAYNTAGNNVTKSMEIKGSVNINKVGKYKITYTITDQAEKTATKTVTYTVKEDTTKPTIKGVGTRIYKYSEYKNKALKTYVYKGVSAYVGNSKLANNYLTYSSKILSNTGEYIKYEITYKAINPKNKKTVTAKGYIVLDKKAPIIQGVEGTKYFTEKEFATWNTNLKNKKYTGISISDGYTPYSKLKITTTLQEKANYEYMVTFAVTDEAGLTTKKSMKVFVLKDATLEVIKPITEVNSLEEVTVSKALENVKFLARGTDYTSMYRSKIKVTMVVEEERLVVTYELKVGELTITNNATYIVKQQTEVVPAE